MTQSNSALRPFFVYRLLGISLAKAATDWGRKAPSAVFCTDKRAVSIAGSIFSFAYFLALTTVAACHTLTGWQSISCLTMFLADFLS